MPQTSMTSGEGAYWKPPSSQHQASAASSTLIDSCHNQPSESVEKRGDPFSGSQAYPRTSRPSQSTEHEGFRPPPPGFRPEIVQPKPSEKTIQISLGLGVIDKIKADYNLLNQLIWDLKSLKSRFQWEPPDHIIIKCWSEESEDWEKVYEMMERLVQKTRQQMQRDRQLPHQNLMLEADRSEMDTSRSVNNAGMLDRSSSAPHAPSASAVSIQKPPESEGQVCAEINLDADAPRPAISTVLVEGLASTTTSDAIRFFFSNKKRNGGGPVMKVDRGKDKTTALVHFENAEDAKSVVKKGGHKFDGQDLSVSLHRAANSVDRTGQQTPPQPLAKAESSSSRSGTSPDNTMPWNQYNQHPPMPQMARDCQERPSPSDGRGFTGGYTGDRPGSQFPSSARAQMKHEGPPDYSPACQSMPPGSTESSSADSFSPAGPQENRWPMPQTSMTSGEGAYWKPPSSQHQASAASSALIDSCHNQPAESVEKRGDPFSGSQAYPRTSRPSQSTEHEGFRPPPPGFRHEIVQPKPSEKTIQIRLGLDVIDKIKADYNLLNQLIRDLKSLKSRFQWEPPDHIIIKCWSEESEDWEKKVYKMMERLVQKTRQQMQRDRQLPHQNLMLEADRSEMDTPRSVNNTGMLDRSSSAPHAPSASAVGIQKPPEIGMLKDIIPNLKPGQMKILKNPKALEKLKRDYRGLEISVDETEKTAFVTAPGDVMKKAFSDVLAFLTQIQEKKVPVSRALAQMCMKKDAVEWIQKTLIEKLDLPCDWEVRDDHIILYGQRKDLQYFEEKFKRAFEEYSMPLLKREACLLKSPAWTSFKEKMQEMKNGEGPAPVLFHEGDKIILVDTLSNMTRIRAAVRNFFAENQLKKEVLQVSPNKVKFLELHCKEQAKAILQKARDAGVSAKFTVHGMEAEGPTDSLAETVEKVRELVDRIQEDKMTFKKPGMATYLTGPKGQEFLSQTGRATECYITTKGSGGGGGGGTTTSGDGEQADESGGQVFAEIHLDADHQVLIVQGDITQCQVDAIVNAANTRLSHGTGVAEAIVKAGGQSIQDESYAIADKGELSEGEVVVTGAGSLNCSHILHAVGPIWEGGHKDEAQTLKRTVTATLRKAEDMELTSVAMPAISCGISRYPKDQATGIIMEAIHGHYLSVGAGSGLKMLMVVEVKPETLQALVTAAKRWFGTLVKEKRKAAALPASASWGRSGGRQGERGAERDSSEERDRGDRGYSSSKKDTGREIDVFIYATQKSAITEARDKIYKHMKFSCTSYTESNSLIANFSRKQSEDLLKLQKKHDVEISLDQKTSSVIIIGVKINVYKAVSSMKDILLSATNERHLAAGMPPVRWQYESGKGKFSDFEPDQILDIEAAFKKKKEDVHFSDKRGRKYRIVFRERKEYPLDPQGRPVTVRRRDILDERRQEIPLPAHWKPMKGATVKRVDLKPDSNEYKKVAAHFGARAPIKKIERIQNPSLFQQYKVKKKELEQNNPKGTENEKRLFHGTPSDSVEGIITNGFNRSYCGRHGTALGNGVYFAADSATSMGYAQGGQMFQARVLVGEYTPGNSRMRMAPDKPNSKRPYDSVSNAPQGATVFVIFHDSQAYPEYLISF